MPREHVTPSVTAGTARISGTLGPELEAHARERIRYFFMFIFGLDAACRRAAAIDATFAVNPADVVDAKATLQVDTGLRAGGNPAYTVFDNTDPNVVNLFATGFSNTDAAHFCNLGLQVGPLNQLMARATGDEHVAAMINFTRAMACDTRLLPQRVNIGPDRVVDVAHGNLAEEFLRPRTPICTRANVQRYIDVVNGAMAAYALGHALAGNAGITACCDRYRAVYAAGPDAPFNRARDGIWAECYARRAALNVDDYVA